MFPIFLALSPIASIAGAFWARFVSRKITDSIIDSKICEIREHAVNKIKEWYLAYIRDLCISIILNVLVIAITFIFHFIFAVNPLVICLISAITIAMFVRTIVLTIRSIVKTIIPNWDDIRYYGDVFIHLLGKSHRLQYAIRDTIRTGFFKTYNDNTNDITRYIHDIASALGIVKSSGEIADDVVDEFYSLLTSYTIRVFIYKVAAFLFFVAVFAFLLRPFVFVYAVKLNIFEIVFYPFTVALPAAIENIRGIW